MTNVVKLKVVDVDHFGGCPRCGRVEKWRNVYKTHWLCCDSHKVRWSPGSNLFSSWREENHAVWEANEALILGYAEVEPLSAGKRLVRP
jgi:uncharacterized C2H2 Zn-finger protein